MDVQAAVGVVDQLRAGGIILIGGHGVEAASGGLLEGCGHLRRHALHVGDVIGIHFRIVGAIAPGVEHALDAGVQRGHCVDLVVQQEVLDRLHLRLGGRSRASVLPGIGADDAGLNGLHVEAVPLVVEGAVHVDAAVARIVAQDAVAVPVRTLHAEARRGLAVGLHIGRAAIERGDVAVAVDVGVGIGEGRAVAVQVAGTQVLAGVVDEGLLVAIGVDHRHDVDHVVVQNLLHLLGRGLGGQPPGEVHRAGCGLALAAVDVRHHRDAGLVVLVHLRVGQLHAPQGALLIRPSDGIELGYVRIGLRNRLQLRFQLRVGVARVPVDGGKIHRFGQARGGQQHRCQHKQGDNFDPACFHVHTLALLI